MSKTTAFSVYLWAFLAIGIHSLFSGETGGTDGGLVAHWDFDDVFGSRCMDVSLHGWDAMPASNRAPGYTREEGIWGTALRFSRSHRLCAAGNPVLASGSAITVSAWFMPTKWDQYNEILRKEDGPLRILFSFQEEGNVLSFGLNVNGYVECDAKTDPQALLDGFWHHGAGTFDGQTIRVYLDGIEIGSLARPGAITSGGEAPLCIGSANGGECFQGCLEDVRVYARAFSAAEVAEVHDGGQAVLRGRGELAEANEPVLPAPVFAQWTFNERGSTAVVHGAGAGGGNVAEANRVLRRIRGVHGNAVVLSGSDVLPVELAFAGPELSAISFSAWVRPYRLNGYREIFRQECGNRLLFSFQDNGNILSLGLNIGGYLECDAPLSPAALLDGNWHHCAGTFDGTCMRVYLDGTEIGMLEHPGRVSVQSGVTAFVGSSSGNGEFFDGALDDLRIYTTALSAAEVTGLHRAGIESLAAASAELAQRLTVIYTGGSDFAAAVASCRQAIKEKGVRLDREFADVLLARIRTDYPEDTSRFTEWTQTDVLEYLLADGNALQQEIAERMAGLLLEYKPLTEVQKSRMSPEDGAYWAEQDELAARLRALSDRGDSEGIDPEWIRLYLAAGQRIVFRPYLQEAVAPFVRPETPETRDLTVAEAEEMLVRDWLYQADGHPTVARALAEIGWARELAERLRKSSGAEYDVSAELAVLAALEEKGAGRDGEDREFYLAVRRAKRDIILKNPLLDFPGILFVDMPLPQGREWAHETRHRQGYQAVPGARLLVLEGLSPAAHLRQLMPQAPLHGSFWRPDVSFDAKKILFCYKPHNEKSFHLYEMNADGSGLVQLTDGPYDDLDPIYLPDEGHIIFSTTRGHTYVRCMPPTNAFVLARCDRDGRNIYLISRANEPDYLPSVLNDGRIIYTRWEYTDKPLWRAQGLWTVNPDGTQVNTFWGNQSVWPDLLKDARSIPGSRRIMFTGSAHHNWFAGSVGIIDPDRGRNFPDGLYKVTADVGYPESGNGPVDPVASSRYHSSGRYSAYYSPCPISETDFLVSANRGGRFVLYLMDVDGNRELIYEGAHHILHAIPLAPRLCPPLIHDRVTWPSREEARTPKPGLIYSRNVYEGMPASVAGKARYLRVLSIEHKTYTYWHKRPYLSTGPVVSAVQSDGVKRILGTVPIEADGSVSFMAPAGLPLHFQILDEQYRALQTMRSFTGVMPGENRGCVGCHEMHSVTPSNAAGGLASRRSPDTITPPPWGDESVSFPRFVQPVLDRYCGSCHQGEGKARKVLDLTDRPGFLCFSEPYLILTGRPTWGSAYRKPDQPPPGWGIADMLMVEGYTKTDPEAYVTPPPMTHLSYRSRLVEIAGSGNHHGVKADAVSLRRLIAWVDTMCPYRGTEEILELPDPEFQGVDWLAVRPRIHTAPTIVRPGPVD